MKIVVLAKQVPDTANIKGNAMKEDGTVNRAALPAIFNPEDLNALEMALAIKDKVSAHISVITMGPNSAVEVLRQSLYRGADHAYLVTDRRFAGSDTLATSYILSEAIKTSGGADLVLAGRQAIDGDTAQVGPQVAEKLNMNQVTYVSQLREIHSHYLIVERDGEVQTEIIKASFPLLMTVTSQANTPRYPSAHLMLKCFRFDRQDAFTEANLSKAQANQWIIPILDLENMKIDESRCGFNGSPTKVFTIKNITLKGGELEIYENHEGGIKALIRDIMKDYIEVTQ